MAQSILGDILQDLLMDEWLNILSDFLATFAGVGLAFGLTFWYDRHLKRVETRETKIRILEAISLEYQMTLNTLGQSINAERKQVKLIRFSTLAIDSAVGSGDLSLLDPKIQHEISEISTYLNQAEMYSEKILSMIGSADMAMSNAAIELERFRVSLEATENVLRVRIPEVMKVLEDEVARLRKQKDS